MDFASQHESAITASERVNGRYTSAQRNAAKPITASHTDTSDYRTLSDLGRLTIFKTPDVGKVKQRGQSKQNNYGNI